MISSINSQATQSALLQWADAMLTLLPDGRETTLKVKKPENLFDGAFFSLLLEILDPKYNPTRFEQSLAASIAGDDQKRRNMHIIHMGLIDFARRQCPVLEPLIKRIDFQALDREPTKTGMFEVNTSSRPSSSSSSASSQSYTANPLTSHSQRLPQPLAKILCQILVAFLYATLKSEGDNHRYVSLIMRLDRTCQGAAYGIIQEVDAKLGQLAGVPDSDDTVSSSSPHKDADLAHEAVVADLKREADDARRQAGGLKIRLDRLQDNYDELVTKHEQVQDENEQMHKQIETEAGNFDRHRLQRQLKEGDTLIANLENERNFLSEERDRLIKDKARLEATAKKVESLLDENQELRSHNEELSKRANMADNLRKKVEANKHLQAELENMRNEKLDSTKAYTQLEQSMLRIEALRRETEAYSSKMQAYELDIANMREQKLILTSQNNELKLQLSGLEQQTQLDEAVFRDLREKVMMLDPSAVTSDSIGPAPTSLEDELSGSSNAVSAMASLEVQRLQAENAVLKSSIGTETEKGQLIQEMEDLRASRQSLQDKYNEIFERFTVGQKQLDALIQNMGKDGLVRAIQACYDVAPDTKWLMSDYFREDAYSNLRTQVLAEQGRSRHLERQLEAFQQQLADKDRALLEARGDCKAILLDYYMNDEDADNAEKVNAVEKSSMDALAELKITDGMLAVSLRAELDAERKKYKSLKDESEAMQKQLLTAFIDKDELRREAEQANLELQKAADGHSISTDSIKQSEKMEKLRTKYRQLQQVSQVSSNQVPSSSSSDRDDADVVDVDVKRRSMWEAFYPWSGNKEQPESGFYPYQMEDDGSISLPDRPVSKMSLRGGGGSSADVSIVSGMSGYNSPSRMSAASPAPSIPERQYTGSPQYEQAELKNRELERTLKAVRAGSDPGAQKAQSDQVIKNLQRENAMIATAWYDLSSRLQSNHVVLQRRNEVPRSWLNKQRQMVNATPRR
ncbi:Uu.00g064560.m01.CDS01 [Anthostomella pinea]|uniref:Uu.00g064560.m01.CDS01 n=1 Tax=Anthostomella pinea TaxID=933095 RepID=A0AAI8VTK3_9PEZI|nr:Uu.00g064560.m01.CDS01 [Anthostomella pinea]